MSKPLLDVLNNRVPKRRPVWLMRQAGRYLPEYRALRAKAGSFLDLCYHPAMAAEVTLQPLHRFDLDAAILFSDILVVPQAMGLKLEFRENEGPVLQRVEDMAAVRSLRTEGEFAEFQKVAETVARVKQDLPPGKTLIGFCGAPWTVASYMIEGGSSDRGIAKRIALQSPLWFEVMIDALVALSVDYLSLQVVAGAEALQIFDSWAGDLPRDAQLKWVDAPIQKMIGLLKARHPDVPLIVFARGIGARHGEVAQLAGVHALSVEQGVSLQNLLPVLPSHVALQGNLDPSLLLGSEDLFRAGVAAILNEMPMHRHIFNLGHGIQPTTNPDRVALLVKLIREHDRV